MEIDYQCVFCQRCDINLYEMNENSVLIEGVLVDFKDLVVDLFSSKLKSDQLSYLCETCKDSMIQFYVFKTAAEACLSKLSIIQELKNFLSSRQENDEIAIIKITDKEFIVSYNESYDSNTEENIDKSSNECETDELFNIDGTEESYEEFLAESQDNENDGEVFTEESYIGEEVLDGDVDSNKNLSKKYEIIEAPVVVIKENHEKQEDKTFSRPIQLVKNAVVINSKSNLCFDCNVTFKDKKYYLIHEKAHENFSAICNYIELNKCSQKNCKMVFSNNEDLKVHLKLDHETIPKIGAYEDVFQKLDEREFHDKNLNEYEVCGHCGRKYTEHNMKIHLIFFHTNSISCPFDKQNFEGHRQVRQFSLHIRNKHPQIFHNPQFLYQCRHCKESFSSNFKKLAHMKVCKSKVYQCHGHCTKRFSTEWHLKTHLKYLGDNRFKCDICSKKCISRSDLEIHMRCHTNERPFECSFCFKKFKTSANRSSHMDIHESTKKHECETCGEKFQTRPILRKHKKKHDDNYQLNCKCKICEHIYLSRPHLLRHMKSVHKVSKDLKTSDIDDYWKSIEKKL